MATQLHASVEESRLRTIERDAAPLSQVGLGERPAGDPRVRRYLEALPPRTALDLVDELRHLRRTLEGAVAVLHHMGFTTEAYLALDDAERASPLWRAVRRAWETTGGGPEYLLHTTRGAEPEVRIFASREAALDAAIEALEMCEGYPEAIELQGGRRLMDRAAILRAWEERHDPG